MVNLRARVQALGDVVRASCSASPGGQSASTAEQSVSPLKAAKLSSAPLIASASSTSSSSLPAAAARLSISPTRSLNQNGPQSAIQSSLSSSINHLPPPILRAKIESPVSECDVGRENVPSAGSERAGAAAALALAQQSKITGTVLSFAQPTQRKFGCPASPFCRLRSLPHLLSSRTHNRTEPLP